MSISGRHNRRRASRSHPRPAFTLIELIVATLVTSLAVLAAFEAFKTIITIEARTAVPLAARSRARSVLDQLCGVLEGALNSPAGAAVAGGKNEDGTFWMECVTAGAGGAQSVQAQPGIQRRRYEWGTPEGQQAISLTLRVMTYAGGSNVTPVDAGEDVAWQALPPRLAADGLDAVSIRYMPTGDAEAEWKDEFSGKAGQVLVRVSVTVHGETVGRVVYARANAELIPKRGGDSSGS